MQHKVTSAQASMWSQAFRGWHYYPQHVMPPTFSDGLGYVSIDCPLVVQIPGRDGWFMFYTGFDNVGYQTSIAHSYDLIHWEPAGLAMSYGKKDAYDFGGVTFGGMLLQSYDIKAPRYLKKHHGMYWVLYGCYPQQGGYELRPGAEGVAVSNDGLSWNRVSDDTPILSVNGASTWEQDCIYQPWLLEDDGLYYNFYNAANGHLEQTGLALSDDMLNWRRHLDNPILALGNPGEYDDQFCSDPKVLKDGDHWVMLYFGVGRGGAHIMAAYSNDLRCWTKDPEPLYKAGGHPTGLDMQYAHKVSLVYRSDNDTYYMFYNAVGVEGRGIGLLTSKPV